MRIVVLLVAFLVLAHPARAQFGWEPTPDVQATADALRIQAAQDSAGAAEKLAQAKRLERGLILTAQANARATQAAIPTATTIPSSTPLPPTATPWPTSTPVPTAEPATATALPSATAEIPIVTVAVASVTGVATWTPEPSATNSFAQAATDVKPRTTTAQPDYGTLAVIVIGFVVLLAASGYVSRRAGGNDE